MHFQETTHIIPPCTKGYGLRGTGVGSVQSRPLINSPVLGISPIEDFREDSATFATLEQYKKFCSSGAKELIMSWYPVFFI